MPRQYARIMQYEEEIFRLKEEGYTHREIATKLGFTYEQIREFVHRHNKRQKRIAAGDLPKPKGRPRVRALSAEEELRKEIERLQMENELLRDFLSKTERM